MRELKCILFVYQPVSKSFQKQQQLRISEPKVVSVVLVLWNIYKNQL